jgi:hypothetical protein
VYRTPQKQRPRTKEAEERVQEILHPSVPPRPLRPVAPPLAPYRNDAVRPPPTSIPSGGQPLLS